MVHHTFGRVLRTSTPRFVGPSVRPSHFTFFYHFISLTSLLLPKWSGDHKYGPCPPARDFGSRVSGLVFSSFFFLVACARLYNPLYPSVGRSVGWSVGRLFTFYFFYDLISSTSRHPPKWSSDLKYGPCPPAWSLPTCTRLRQPCIRPCFSFMAQ